MSNEVKVAIRATVAALKAELARRDYGLETRMLAEKAIKAAEKLVGTPEAPPPGQ